MVRRALPPRRAFGAFGGWPFSGALVPSLPAPPTAAQRAALHVLARPPTGTSPLVETRSLLPGFARLFESTMKRRRKMMNKHKVKKRKRAARMKANK